jgi:transposase-like protein
VVAEYERSGLSRRSFCKQAGVAVSTLDYWRRQVRAGNGARIVPVKVESAEAAVTPGRCPGFQLSLSNGVRIESGWDFPEQGMARLLRVAAER